MTDLSASYQEVSQFEQSAQQWWDLEGEFSGLHKMNPIRLSFINDSRGDIFEEVTRCHINIKNESYHFDKGNDIARIYWIEQLLPDIYADIFTNAMMYNRDNLDQIENTARKLNEVLKQ